MLNRRKFLMNTAALGALTAFRPGLSLARTETDGRLVVVLLRGALDGLAAVPPYGDGNYARVRGELALAAPGQTGGVLKLDGLFGLHPALPNLHGLYRDEEALIVHAAATPYRSRSHFDGQNLLENGTNRPFGASDGWLNRVIADVPKAGRDNAREYGVALGQNVSLLLRGSESVASWAPSLLNEVPDETLTRLMDLYADDTFFSTRLARAMEIQANAPPAAAGRMGPQRFVELAKAAGGFLKDPEGPRIAMLEAGGWDTHANQGAHEGQLANRLGILDRGVAALRDTLGSVWSETAVVIVSEFGRTVAVNGTRGTDHGTAGVMLIVGGAVAGGSVIADWPGLGGGDLYEGRDLRPTVDTRSVFKGILADHLSVPRTDLETRVFPNSGNAAPLEGLIRAA